MALSTAQILALSRLLDELLDAPPAAREARLAALPADQQTLLPHLRQMLAQAAASQGPLSTLPRLPDDPQEPPDAQPGERVGPYRLLRELGRGGMGAVWLAERADGIFSREVALKMPRLSRHASLGERMARERQIGARLEHPHIARLYDAGIDDQGRPYLVMERLEGLDLLAHAQAHALDQTARLRLMLQVCEAVAHAHRQLVVHRDLKPSNLMVTADGQVKLLDFGIAELLDAAAPDGNGNTAGTPAAPASDRMHTPRYAAPEQRRGDAVSTASDIYSLGVVLCELLTGRLPPVDSPADPPAEPAADVGQRHRAWPELPPDLAAVLRRALQPRPQDRYSSVERLADDLRAVLAHRPVTAEPPGRARRLQLFLRRHRAALGAGTVAATVLVSGLVFMWVQRGRELAQAERAALSREFLFDFLEDAEPVAGQTAAQMTGLQMVQSARDRALRSFTGQPALRGQVLTEVGVMMRRLGQPDEAARLLREAGSLLARHTDADDAALPIAQAQLATTLNAGRTPQGVEEATGLARSALAACAGTSDRCAKAQAYANDVLMRQANARGERALALQHGRLAVAANERAFGPGHAEVASALMQLAIILRNMGALREAGQVLQRAEAIALATPLRAADQDDLALYQASIRSDLGQFDAVRRQLGDLLASPADPAAPPASDALQRRALYLRLLAQAQVAQGLLGEALSSADAALALAQAGANVWEVAFCRQSRARALSGLGRHAEAAADIAATLAGLAQLKLPPAGIEQLRARRFAAELALRAQHLDDAAALLDPLPPAHRQVAPGATLAAVDLAQALDLQGSLLRMRGDLPRAQGLHREAAALLGEQLPADHLLRLRNAVLSELATWLANTQAGNADADRSALQQAVLRYRDALPATSAWRQLPDARTAAPAAWQLPVL